jgi:cytochrome c2
MMRAVVLAGIMALATGCAEEAERRRDPLLAGGESTRGLEAIRRHGCGGCHLVPGLPEARGRVGPSLQGLAGRPYLAGRLTNHGGNLVTWIQTPRAIDPGTIMPELGVSDTEARDIATYLYERGPAPARTGPTWPPAVPREGAP